MENKYNMIIKNKEKLISNLLINYSSILNKTINQLYFIYNGKHLSINNKKRIIDFKKMNIITIFPLLYHKLTKNVNLIIQI